MNKRSLLLFMMMTVILVGGLITTRFLLQQHLLNTSPTSTPQINIPDVEYPTIPPSAPEFSVPMQSLDNSGLTGKVTFKDVAGAVAILIRIEGLADNEESEEEIVPTELHYGTCEAPGELAYPMSPPDAGASETDLDINLKQFNAQKPMAVILYRSLQDHTPIACADVH